jgi:hypothetical protein
MPMLNGLWRDLAQAGRSLAKARGFTFICVVSLGVGMTPVIAVPYVSRITRTPPQGVITERLVEVVTTPLGPRGATDAWSYPDFLDLRAADPGIEIAGWTGGPSNTTIQTPAGVETRAVATMFVTPNYFKTVGVALARGPGLDPSIDGAMKSEPVVVLGYNFWKNQRHHRQDADVG